MIDLKQIKTLENIYGRYFCYYLKLLQKNFAMIGCFERSNPLYSSKQNLNAK